MAKISTPSVWPSRLAAHPRARGRSRAETRFIINARQLIFEGRRSGEGYFSPDGNRLIPKASRRTRNPFYQIYRLRFQTAIPALSSGTRKTTCGFFRRGNRSPSSSLDSRRPLRGAKKNRAGFFRGERKTPAAYSWTTTTHSTFYSAPNTTATDP